MTSKLFVFVSSMLSACASVVTPSADSSQTDAQIVADRSEVPDVVTYDGSSESDVVLRQPTSMIRVSRIPASATRPLRAEALVWLYLPGDEGGSVEEREIDGCVYRRVPMQRRIGVGTARWRFGFLTGLFRTLGVNEGPFVADEFSVLPTSGDAFEVSLVESSFPSFSVSQVMPSALEVRRPATDVVQIPPVATGLDIEWGLPTNPAVTFIQVGWASGVNIYCFVPAARGEFTMSATLVDLFRGATDARLSVGHANAIVTRAGDRPLRYVVENNTWTRPFAR